MFVTCNQKYVTGQEENSEPRVESARILKFFLQKIQFYNKTKWND